MKLGERQSLRQVYFRWAIVSIVVVAIFAMAVLRYNREVAAIPIEALLQNKPDGVVRVLGRVVAGTLKKQEVSEPTFTLSGEGMEISVRYVGKADDNLRESKVLVVAGFFNPEKMEFTAQSMAPIPNVGFIMAAYLLSVIPLILFLFNMERNLVLLSVLIKEERPYQPEEINPSSHSRGGEVGMG